MYLRAEIHVHPQRIWPTTPWTDYWTDFESEKRLFEKIDTDYNTSTGFYRPKLFVNPSRANTHKVAIPE
jgi:hypothetical protein